MAMLKKSLNSATVKLTFFADPKGQWQPPSLPNGRSPSHVQVAMGTMDLASSVAAPCRYKRAVVEQLKRSGLWNNGQVDFAGACLEFAVFLPRNSRGTLRWFSVQLVWLAGMAVEEHCLAEVRGGSGAQLAKLPKTGQTKQLYKYSMAGRKAFHKPRCLHMALGGGTLGKKQTTVGVIWLSNNQAMIVPSQVWLGECGVAIFSYYRLLSAYYREWGLRFLYTFFIFPRTTGFVRVLQTAVRERACVVQDIFLSKSDSLGPA